MQARWFGLLRVRSPLLAESLICFLFLQVLRWFTSLRCLPPAYGFSRGSPGINREGLPHSDISGSKLVCSLPELIAAYRVLHRLLAPRHSPYALSSLTIRNSKLTLSVLSPWCFVLSPLLVTKDQGPRTKNLLRQFHAHCVRGPSAAIALVPRVCGRKKLPFAEYSVVKELFRRSLAPAEKLLAALARRLVFLAPSVLAAREKPSGEYRARTGDLLVANQALSQLS